MGKFSMGHPVYIYSRFFDSSGYVQLFSTLACQRVRYSAGRTYFSDFYVCSTKKIFSFTIGHATNII